MAVRLTGPGGGVIEVPEESADHWRGLGYKDESPAKAAPKAKKAPAKKAAAKKAPAKKTTRKKASDG